ncbi:hypothetical protein GCM10022402_20890 [Salinactinospora qingdaonensis]|uniref:Uncharacterized protein n=1 Tax=Salinactinospora qingdaonensis TaxID=702744 RepID=A0ABP7FLT3_9ACTN
MRNPHPWAALPTGFAAAPSVQRRATGRSDHARHPAGTAPTDFRIGAPSHAAHPDPARKTSCSGVNPHRRSTTGGAAPCAVAPRATASELAVLGTPARGHPPDALSPPVRRSPLAR